MGYWDGEIGYDALLATARRLRDFAKLLACGADGVREDGTHSCVHDYDDPTAAYRCRQARALLASPDVQALGREPDHA